MIVTLPQFIENKQCELCPLHEGVINPCVPTRDHIEPTRTDRAILIIGGAPGDESDRRNRPFAGPSGLMLRKCYIEFFDLTDKADLYITDAIRCRPPQ